MHNLTGLGRECCRTDKLAGVSGEIRNKISNTLCIMNGVQNEGGACQEWLLQSAARQAYAAGLFDPNGGLSDESPRAVRMQFINAKRRIVCQ